MAGFASSLVDASDGDAGVRTVKFPEPKIGVRTGD
jgi:hypothetical protein